ncbi:MAG: thioredoxin domain-containing protein [Phycisphaerales bacterium]
MPSPHASNRLSSETSPYLLQHAHNPVAWLPWGEEAFAKARRRGVPIFLSIGYSTCYWCHVMERESFEDETIARQLNDSFVPVKVDREERPDVDDLYMTATQLLSGRGGWPMSVFLEPSSLRPFFAGTYFPPEPRHGMPGFPQLLEAMSHAWRDRRGEVLEQASSVAEGIRQHMAAAEAPVALGLGQVASAAQTLLRQLDRVHGGFGSAPKFPQPAYLEFLLDVRDSAADDATRDAADTAIRVTLDRMGAGGLFDHAGGGFHRYSVDERWLVPHFEKMLYDNAQLAALYARAGRVYNDDWYRRVARRTLDYVLREMTTQEGAFASAQDAEVDGREGGNYLWNEAGVRAAVPPALADFAVKAYHLDRGPNFRDPHHPDAPPANILHLDARPERLAQSLGLSPAEFESKLAQVNAALYAARATRKQPRLDDKVITAWNGLMIAALARAGAALSEPRYLDAAERAAGFILSRLRGQSGLLRTYRAGQAKTPAFLEDYAFVIDALLSLTAAGRDHLAQAKDHADEARRLFGDPGAAGGPGGGGGGGYFDTRADQPDLFLRARSTHDGALPSGSSVMLQNLVALHDLTRDPRYLDDAIATLASLSAAVARSPTSTINAVRSLLALLAEGDAIAAQLAALGPAPPPPAAASPADFSPVEVYASTDRVAVGPGTPARLRLVVRIAPGHHITAADPGPGGQGLVPLRVHVVNGTGIAAYADYPQGEPYGPDADIRIHKGSLEFDVALESTGSWSGRPLLAVTFQACTDTECLEPQTVELAVAIDRAP